MKCPRCGSDNLMIRQRTGFERIVLAFTGNRKYICLDCGRAFRAPDRRKKPRSEKARAAGG
ncbi:MAG: hypothetical protein KGN84_08235 [Acidobacteriota bacterium]|nr:hypothetical protein [Acidobacteriota bacterium]